MLHLRPDSFADNSAIPMTPAPVEQRHSSLSLSLSSVRKHDFSYPRHGRSSRRGCEAAPGGVGCGNIDSTDLLERCRGDDPQDYRLPLARRIPPAVRLTWGQSQRIPGMESIELVSKRHLQHPAQEVDDLGVGVEGMLLITAPAIRLDARLDNLEVSLTGGAEQKVRNTIASEIPA